MVKQNSVTGKHVVSLSVVDHNPVGVEFGYPCNITERSVHHRIGTNLRSSNRLKPDKTYLFIILGLSEHLLQEDKVILIHYMYYNILTPYKYIPFSIYKHIIS